MKPYEGNAMVFTIEERRTLLDEFFAIRERLEDASLEGRSAPEDLERHAELRRAYREKLPVLPLSRCPFTKAIYTHSIDPYGIDGLWWDYRSPNRPLELLGGNIVAFTGAMRLGGPLELMPFLCKPGPGVPFVVPRMLQREGVRAVISSLPIGAHIGYIIVYFGNPAPDDLEGFNDWGTDDYQFESGPGRFGWNRVYATLSDYDFELDKWLISGELLWIAPDDTILTLREGIAGCPYVDLGGRRQPQLIQDGEVWYEELCSDSDSPVQTTPEEQLKMQSAGEPRMVQPEEMPAAESPGSVCGNCGMVMPVADARFCMGCGSSIMVSKPAIPAESVCPSCGNSVSPTAKFCKHCGYKLTKS